VAFNPVPPTVTFNPVARNPLCVVVRITNVVARNPDVPPSVPSPVTRVPNVIVTWRRWRRFNPDRRRSNPDDYPLCHRPWRHCQCAPGDQQCGENSDYMRFGATVRLPLHIHINHYGPRKLRNLDGGALAARTSKPDLFMRTHVPRPVRSNIFRG
jgi:hypothetical protein